MTAPVPAQKWWIWEVQCSIPPEDGREWRRNITCWIITDTTRRALDIVEAAYPGVSFHQIMRRNQTDSSRVFIDDKLFAAGTTS